MEIFNNVNDIKTYIIIAYPDSSLASNYNTDTQYPETEMIKECESFFYYEVLNWCGCGCSDLAKKTIRDYLEIVRCRHATNRRGTFDRQLKDRFGVTTIYESDLLLCLAYTLDAAGFTEHGSSIGSAWLTEEGEMFLWLLKQNAELDS